MNGGIKYDFVTLNHAADLLLLDQFMTVFAVNFHHERGRVWPQYGGRITRIGAELIEQWHDFNCVTYKSEKCN